MNGRIDYDKTKMHFYVNIKALLMTYRHTTRMKVNNYQLRKKFPLEE